MKRKITFILTLAFLSYAGAYAQSLEWAGSFGGNGEDVVLRMHVDGPGNVYTTGYFTWLCDFDISDEVSNVQTGVDFTPFVQKTDADGNFVWARKIGGGSIGNSDDVTTDNHGNVYVTGVFTGSADFDPGEGESTLEAVGDLDIFVVKLNSDGDFLWARSFGGTAYEEGQGIGVDSQGSIYISGYFYDTMDCDPGSEAFNLTPAGFGDGFLVKLNISGDFVWAKQFGGTEFDFINAMEVTKNGDVYLAGNFEGTADFDPDEEGEVNLSTAANAGFLVHLNTDGELVKAVKTVQTNSFISSLGIDLDSHDAAYITGFFGGDGSFALSDGSTASYTAPGLGIGFVAKVADNGDLEWGKFLDADLGSLGYDIAISAADEIAVTGFYDGELSLGSTSFTRTTENAYENFIAQMNVDGNFVSAYTFGGANFVDRCAIGISDDNMVYASGAFENSVDINPISGNELTAESIDFRDNYLIKMKFGTLGIPDVINNAITIYPNPASGVFSLGSPANLEGKNFDIFELTGKKLTSGTIGFGREINISQLATGTYVLKIDDGSYKIMKN